MNVICDHARKTKGCHKCDHGQPHEAKEDNGLLPAGMQVLFRMCYEGAKPLKTVCVPAKLPNS